MWRTAFRRSSPGVQMMLLAFLLVSGWMIAYIISLLVLMAFHFNPAVLGQIHPGQIAEYEKVLQILQVIQSIGLFIAPPFLFAWLVSDSTTGYLKLKKNPNIILLTGAIVLLLFSLPFVNFLGDINSRMEFPRIFSGIETWMRTKENTAKEITDAFLSNTTVPHLLFNLFMIALLPALGEELLFRGVLQQIFVKWLKNGHAAIWLAAFLFAALHLQFFGILPRFLLGAFLGYLFYWSGSLWYPITVHFTNNALAVIFYWLINSYKQLQVVEDIGTQKGIQWPVLVSIFFVIAGLWWLQEAFKHPENYIKDN